MKKLMELRFTEQIALTIAIFSAFLQFQKLRAWQKNPDAPGLAYEVQEAITDVLAKKTLHAKEQYHAKSILISGGAAANLRLREKLPSAIAPPIHLCTDNAVYIASYAFFRGKPTDWHEVTAIPDLSVEI